MTAEINALANDALDIAFADTAGKAIRNISAAGNFRRGKLQIKLKALDKEATALAEDDLKFDSDNEVLLEAMDAYEDHLASAQTTVIAEAPKVEDDAVALAVPVVVAKLFPKRSEELMDQGTNPLDADNPEAFSDVDEEFVEPEEEDTDFYTASLAWQTRVDRWGAGYSELSRETIRKGMAAGWGAIRIAKTLRNHAENIPASAARNLLFTLLLTSYRNAQLVLEKLNGGLLRGKIRIAVLDNRTCLACIALHGTPLAVGQRVDDHYSGRCTAFYQVPGGPDFPTTMQADSIPGQRNFVPFQTGEAWFDSLSASRQAEQLSFMRSPGKLRLFRSGESLNIFEGEHFDDIFGRQTIEKTLKSAASGTTVP